MSYIKLTVRSGGIYIKQKKDHLPFDMNLTPHPKISNQQVLSLVRESSIKGLFSYLMGETKKIKSIEKSTEPLVQKLNTTLNTIQKSMSLKKISEPHITTFFERKDIKPFNKTNPKVNLYQHSFETADATIKLLEIPIKNIMKNVLLQSLGNIYSFFKNTIVQYDKQKKEYEQIIQKAKNLGAKLNSEIPSQKLKKGIKIALKRVEDKKPISSNVIVLIEEIFSLCGSDRVFYQNIENSKYGKFSIFTDLNNTKHWVNKKYHSIVRGAPAFIACVDFDIYLSKESFTEKQIKDSFTWEYVVQKIKSGPNIARWGEGGIVLIEYYLDEMGRGYNRNDKEQIFMEIKAFRKAGMKIKKYDWEKIDDTKTSNKN